MNAVKLFIMRYIFLVLLGFSFLIVNANDKPKNILLLVSDDFNYWASTMNYHPASRTPVIDALAERGVLFTHALNSSPVCNPSRNAFMSGYRPSTTGISANADGYFRDKNGFKNITTMNHFFKLNGYYALAAGKIYHPGSMGNKETDPNNWTELITDGSGCNGGTYRKYDGSQYSFSGNTAAMTTSNCNDYNLAVKIANKIKGHNTSAHKDKPFFIACGLFRPHAPFNSPKQFWDVLNDSKMGPGPGVEAKWMTGNQGTDFQKELIKDGVYNNAVHSYMACMALTDNNIGVILDALEQSPQKDNTIIVFMGDHGFDLGEQGRWGKFAKTKSANHTTFIIYDPSAKGNGQRCHYPVSLQDLYPTLVDLAGLEKRDIEGVSLKHLLDCPNDENWNHPILMTYGGGNYISTNDWYFVEEGNSSLLFSNINDPYQWNNLFGQSQYNNVVAGLRSKIDSMVSIGTKMRADLISTGNVRPENLNPYTPPANSSCNCTDEEPPTKPGSAILEGNSATTLSITWNESTDNDTITLYQIYVNDVFRMNAMGNNAVVDRLICQTSYFVKVRALDNCNNFSEFSESVALSTGQCDTVPPTIPGNFEIMAVTDEAFTVKWDESSDNEGVDGYEVFIDGSLARTSSKLSETFDGFNCGSLLKVKVRSFDYSKNYSEFTAELNVETDECIAIPVPGKIEAENFSNQTGIQTENTSDTGGGLNVGFINNNDWAEYNILVAEPHMYKFDFRVASKYAGNSIDVLTNNVKKGSVTVPVTGDWQNWVTISESFELDAGKQTLKLVFKGGSGFLFNINWIDVQKDLKNNILEHQRDINYLISNVVDESRILHLNLLYSDPMVKIEILDVLGKTVQSDYVPGEHDWWEYELDSSIKSGVYFVKVINHLSSQTQRFIVK